MTTELNSTLSVILALNGANLWPEGTAVSVIVSARRNGPLTMENLRTV